MLDSGVLCLAVDVLFCGRPPRKDFIFNELLRLINFVFG